MADSANITNSVIIEPVYIGENAVITNSVVGPHVSLGAHAIRARLAPGQLHRAAVEATVLNAVITNSMIGNCASRDRHARRPEPGRL
ncbi:MAG: hypothetical protein WKG07_03685 [Hymenobacter sp.]